MQRVALAVIIHKGKIIVEHLREEIRPSFRGVPAVLPGGKVLDGELPEVALKREVKSDIGIDIEIVTCIAERAHPLIPESRISYFFCSVNTVNLTIGNKKKVKSAEWEDLPTAAVHMLTLFSRVFAFLVQQLYGNVLPPNVKVPELMWLSQDFERFGAKIREGELVAFPTETVYGLGAHAFDSFAVEKIFRAKNRPADNPLIVHVSSVEQLHEVAQTVPKLATSLFMHFSPGPLTVLLPKNDNLPSVVTAHSSLVGVRIPANLFALELLAAARVPIAAPSANKSGKPSATHHAHVINAFGSEVPHVVLGGPTTFGVESTVVLPKNEEQIVIMRQGAITKEELKTTFPTHEVLIAGEDDTNLRSSPGTKYKHYAPNGKLTVLPLNSKKKWGAHLLKVINENPHESVCILCSKEVATLIPKEVNRIVLGSERNLSSIAASIFGALLECDAKRYSLVFAQSFPRKGLGRTIMERLTRAAAN
ncbi:MAG: L-threonylcarbamoyladenylate synthase [Patescibacteria group bacterium]